MATLNSRQISGEGTPEAEWVACEALSTLPFAGVQSLVPAEARLVVCAPHPDDEILPCGGLLASAFDKGNEVLVIAITDGEASHGDSFREVLRLSRPIETTEALQLLGVDAAIVRLRMPDGKGAEFEGFLSDILRCKLQQRDIVLVPWRWDGHPDHEAAARAASQAASEVGCVLFEMPIWGWHWSNPNNTPLPWKQAVRFELSESHRQRKLDAIAAFNSQLSPIGDRPPILTQTTLKRFSRHWELYLQ